MSATSRPHLLDRVEEVEALVEELFDPERKDPVVRRGVDSQRRVRPAD